MLCYTEKAVEARGPTHNEDNTVNEQTFEDRFAALVEQYLPEDAAAHEQYRDYADSLSSSWDEEDSLEDRLAYAESALADFEYFD